MPNESMTALIRRAERRVGRPLRRIEQRYMAASELRRAGIRVPATDGVEVSGWQLTFGREGEDATVILGRTLDQAFDIALGDHLRIRKRRKRRRFPV